MHFDERAGALVARSPGPEGRVSDFPRFVKQLLDLLLISEQKLAHGRAHLRLLAGVAPQCVLEEKDILLRDFVVSVQVGMGLEQGKRLPVAPVRGDDVLLAELAPDVGDRPVDIAGNRHRGGLSLHFAELLEADGGPLRLRDGFEHSQEAEVFLDVFDHEAQQEAIVEGHELVVFRQLVTGAEQSQQGNRDNLLAVMEETLVDERENGVEDG